MEQSEEMKFQLKKRVNDCLRKNVGKYHMAYKRADREIAEIIDSAFEQVVK